MTDRARLEALMRGPIQRTCWMSDEPCPRCEGMTLATNGTGAAWCVDRLCHYARQVKRSKKDRQP